VLGQVGAYIRHWNVLPFRVDKSGSWNFLQVGDYKPRRWIVLIVKAGKLGSWSFLRVGAYKPGHWSILPIKAGKQSVRESF